MQIFKAPIDDMVFQLQAFDYERVLSLEPFAAYDFETTKAMIQHTGAFAEEVLLPINRSGDKEGLRWDPSTGDVTTPSGFREAYAKMVENGLVGIHAPTEHGGGGAPLALCTFLSELWTSGNKSLSMCPGLTAGLVEAIHVHGSAELKAAFLPKLSTGEWSGTMCLTEPQCGTDLGLVRTKAVPDGQRYRLTGSKIWITFGEHDLTENIIHLVLARLPDAPPGIKGISTFVVPKITLEGRRNGIRCTGLEHKMGIHASPTCAIDMDEAEGWLVGEPHRGMRAMFTMMNGARLLVGGEGIALGEIAYQTALAFARDRRQGRALDPEKRDQSQPADNILVHPDVRRMLLNIKSTTEGMRGLAAWVSNLIDLGHHHPDAAVRQESDDLAALLTPVIKSYFTERGFLNVSDAMQVCGGAGYTVDWSVEQYLRDVRIAMIYEGTNHIQALDLVGRKLPRDGGRAFTAFCKLAQELVEQTKNEPRMSELTQALAASLSLLIAVTTEMGAKAMADPEQAGAAASSYLNLFGLCALTYAWARQVRHTLANPSALTERKVKTARYFVHKVLPESESLARIIRAGKEPIMDVGPDEL